MKFRHQLALAVALLFLSLASAAAETSIPGVAKTQVRELEAQAESYQYAGDLARAEASFRSALAAGEAAWGDGLPVAATLTKLGNVLRLRRQIGEAERIQRRALEIRERLAPDSPAVADSLHHLFLLANAREDLDAMVELSRRGLDILERRGAGTLAMADALNDVAYIEMYRGEHHKAVESYRPALEILERQAPGSLQLATTLARSGRAFMLIGDPEAADEALRQALAIRERLAPESLGTAVILSNLGALARDRGDLGAAEEIVRRALDLSAKAVPDGLGVAELLNLLGTIALLRGDAVEAWNRHSRALAICERLGHVTRTADTLGFLGLVAEARNDLGQALDLQRRSQALRRPPATIEDALTLHRIGRLLRRLGRRDEAAQALAEAVEILESQVGRLGSQEVQAEYRAQHEGIYRDAIELELERGRPAAAFHLVERSRARSFLALLAERNLEFRELPAELARSRRDNAARYDQKLRELAQAGEETKETLRRDLDHLRQERESIADEIRKASPRAAALREPQPLDLEAARKVLDPGTLALSYSVGKEKTALFAVTREGGLQVKTIPVGEEKLRREVEGFLESVRSQGKPAADLYRELIAPVADLVARSERVLILPDGPLHRLPFGALAHDGRFLIEEKPLHTALSLTVYGTLRSSSPGDPQKLGKLVAFGDPRFPKDMQATQAKRDLSPGLRSFDWSSLPYSRSEVERIARAYPGALVYLGEEATEERAKSIHGARILHFATHGYTDDRTPLDSALVLTIPEKLSQGRDNGLLQVWEIFEGVRIDADLVVLSACESALGREMSGEGLIGLTRAFQYAGARTVAASLWSVADQVTAELMTRFHRHLAAGLPKDQALRAAQIELIREPLEITTANGQALEMDASAPFYWAAFQLFGDWK
ncbi:MAG: hypothetical protein QOH06_3361 [Acidobacteriota bacterium]|jgi:CHAT domain-containing protein/Tfp pilus assembly protein PilF|nr:hypothetical protein [Acidobacteriota bacterium]